MSAGRIATEGVTVQNGLAMGLGLGLGRWSFGVNGDVSFGAEHAGRYASYEVSRDAIAAFTELAVAHTPEATLGAGLDAGAIFLARRTVSATQGATSNPAATNPAFACGLELSFRWLPAALGHRIGPWALVGADIVPAAPTFGYETGQSFTVDARTWKVEPRGQLGLEVRAF